MSEDFTLAEITALLLDEHGKKYPGSIPPKALNKILHFADQELAKENLSAEIPYFWYMYGTDVVIANRGVHEIETPDGKRIDSEITTNEIQASHTKIERARSALSRCLLDYYDNDLEGITDENYTEAPYDVQRRYRELDKQLDAASETEKTTPSGDNKQEAIKSTFHQLVKDFPRAEYSQFEDDLLIWYRVFRAEVTSEKFNPDNAKDLAKAFWRLFCLELARHENNGVTEADIEAELDIDSIKEEQESMRSHLLEQERRYAQQNARDTDTAKKAAEALMTPFLDINVRA